MHNEFGATITNIEQIAKETFQVSFSFSGDGFEFLPGQYIWVILQQLAYPDLKGERRAFSITNSTSEKNKVTIQFRASESGFKKTLLGSPIGSQVKLIGPFGSSYVPTNNQKNIVMLAGGIGIAPFLSILRSLESTNDQNKYTLITINSSIETAVFQDELREITKNHNIPFISHFGRFNHQLFPQSVNFEQDTFFICGSKSMVNAVYEILLKKNVSPEHMRFEQHYPSNIDNLTVNDFLPKQGEKNIMLQAVHNSKNHVIITDANGIIVFANSTAEKNTGFSFEEMKGNTPRLWGGLMSPKFYQNLWLKKHESGGFDGEIINRRKNGEVYYVVAHITPIKNDQGTVIGYIGTEEDITKEKQIDRAKTEFISLASHQLRTPLSTINWYCEMLLAGDAGEITPEQRNFVQQAYDGSQRMSKLVNALLNVSRIETGTYMVDPQEIDIVMLTQEVLAESKPQIEEKKLQVQLQSDTIPKILLDQNLMTIILQNLLTNAIKYTPHEGQIDIIIKQLKKNQPLGTELLKQDSLLIQVTDTGMGIPDSQKNHIFEKLFRADNVRRSNTDGTGLGLYLIKSLIEHSNGKVWFITEEGKGSTFYVLLPLVGMLKKEGEKEITI